MDSFRLENARLNSALANLIILFFVDSTDFVPFE